jgi:hypothetical protein
MNPIKALHQPVRNVAALIGLAFAASPGRATAGMAGQALGAALSLMASYQLKTVVEAASSGSAERAIASAILFAALGGAVWIHQTCYVQILPPDDGSGDRASRRRVDPADRPHPDARLCRPAAACRQDRADP